jgi:ABC-type phosphate/phosphonate transport system substrate-binding protein
MRPSATQVASLGIAGLLVVQVGCQSGASGASILSLFGLSEKPLVIALPVEPGVLNPFAPYEPFRKAMSRSIKRPVRLDLCLPVQFEPNLTLGYCDLAFMTPASALEMGHPERFGIIALPIDAAGQATQGASLVVAAAGGLDAITDLRGKRVAFGPRGDARTHHAGLALLREAGVRKRDLSLALLPIPGSLRHYSDMGEIARSVINGESDGGFIDETALAGFDQAEIRDKLRVIGQTTPLPEKLILGSPKLEAKAARKVTEFLLDAQREHPDALRPLLVAGYQEPTPDFRAAWTRLVKSFKGNVPEPAAETTQ